MITKTIAKTLENANIESYRSMHAHLIIKTQMNQINHWFQSFIRFKKENIDFLFTCVTFYINFFSVSVIKN